MIDRTLFIINPNSSNGAYKPFLNQLKEKEKNAHILLSKSKKHTEDFIKENWEKYDVFVAAGGDGTISSIAQILIFSEKTLAVYPMGSGNGFARENDFNKNIDQLLKKIKNHQSKKIDTLKIGEHFSINVSGVGLDSAVAQSFEKTKRGFANYIKTTIKTFFNFKDIGIQFQNPNLEKYNGKYLMMNIANTRQFGNNAYIAPQAKIDDGKMEIALVKRFPLWYSPIFAYQLFNKTLKNNQYLQYISTKETELSIDFDTWHLDGDAIQISSPITIKVLEKSLKILV